MLNKYVLFPNYYLCIVFICPAIILAVLTAYEKRVNSKQARHRTSTFLSIILSIIFLITGMLIISCFSLFSSIKISTVDLNKYEKVLELNNYPSNEIIQAFPSKVPDTAVDPQFYYLSTIAGVTVALKYTLTNNEEIIDIMSHYSGVARWSGRINDDAKKYGISQETLNIFNNLSSIPTDVIIYILYFQDDNIQSLNHGKLCLVAVSQSKNEITYLAESW